MTIHFVQLDKIKIEEDRQRKEFDPAALAELSDSITNIGLLHPLIVEEDGTLRTGERRLRAISNLYMMGARIKFSQQEVPDNCVPCLKFSDLTLIQKLEIEYDENHKRKDLSWQEQAAATAKLAELRNAQAAASNTPAPTVAELSTELRGSGLGSNQAATRKELIVSKHLHRPEIAKAKSVEEAYKILKKEEVVKKNEQQAAVAGASYKSNSHTALNVDAKIWLKECPADTFDIILTDPPYGMGADEFGNIGGETKHHYADDWASVLPLLETIFREGWRVTKSQAHLYMFCDLDHFQDLKRIAAHHNWTVFRTPLIWHKPSAFRLPWPEHGPRRHYECILYAMKGKKPVTAIYSDVLTHAVVNSSESEYQAQKPVSLYTDLLKRSCVAGAKVLDPCMGSGTIFEAAHEMKCEATGIELLPEPYGIAVKRLEALK